MNYQYKYKKINKLAVFLTLFYAFSTRTILGPFIFRGPIPLLFYGVLYITLGISFIKSFTIDKPHVYAPHGFILMTIVFCTIIISLIHAGDIQSLLYYGIALLIPFSLRPEIKEDNKYIVAFVIIGIILFIGCLINFLSPSVYNAYILPLFTSSDQNSLEWQASFGTSYPGFTSQVGYTSFFLSTAIGGLFCFRKNTFGHLFIPLELILMFGMLLTGKRGPFVYLIIALLIIYFFESHGRDRFIRVFQIIGIVLFIYLVMFLLAKYTGNASIERIFDSLQTFVTTHDVEDAGREQLRNKAMEYFYTNPIFGIGWGNFRRMYTLRSTHVHCIYIQLLCETGIIGFLVFCLFFAANLFGTISKLKNCRDAMEKSWLMFSIFMQIYFLLYGITGNPLYDVEETILYFFSIGIGFLPVLFNFSDLRV